MAKGMRRDRKKEAHWRGHLRRQRGSGLSVRGFCEKHGLSESGFYWWRRELARRDAERRPRGARRRAQAAFAEIEVTSGDAGHGPPTPLSNGAAIEVCLAGGHTIRLRPDFDATTFLRVVALLEGRPSC